MRESLSLVLRWEGQELLEFGASEQVRLNSKCAQRAPINLRLRQEYDGAWFVVFALGAQEFLR